MLPEELSSLQRQICGSVSKESLITDTDFPLEYEISKKKGTQTQTFWSGYLPVGWGVFHVKGWGGAKKLGMDLKTQGNQILSRDIPGFLLGCPGVPENLREKKRFAFNFCPLGKSDNPEKFEKIWVQFSFPK